MSLRSNLSPYDFCFADFVSNFLTETAKIILSSEHTLEHTLESYCV